MTASWPTTALRTSPRTASVTARMPCTSIDDLPPPLMNIARQPHQCCCMSPPWRTALRRFEQNRLAIDRHPARQSDPLQPGDEPVARKLTWSMQLRRNIANSFLDIATDHHVLMTGELHQLGHVLQQPLASGAERRRHQLRRPETAERRP